MTHPSLNPQFAVPWHVGTEWRRIAWLAVVSILSSIAFALLTLTLQFVVIVPLIVWAVLIAVLWRPIIGLSLALILVSLFEMGGPDPLMQPGVYIHYGLQHSLGLSGMIVSPLEILLLVSLLVWLVRGITGAGLDFRGGTLGWPMLFFGLALAAGVLRGRTSGGNMYVGFWELRSLLYILACYVLASNLVRTRAHVRLLIGSLMLGASLFAAEGAFRRLALIDTGVITGSMEILYGHDTVVFLASLVALVVSQQVFGAPRWQRLLGLLIVPIAVFTMLATERRAGQIALIMAVLAIFAVFLVARRKAFFSIAVPVLIAGAIYLPLFWNASGILGQPARAIRSISDPDPRDAASNVWREIEKVNIRATLRAYPLQGVGFGQPFLQVVAVPDISFFPFWDFEPHHNLFWIWLKSGVIGYVIFWMLLGTALARAANIAKTSRSTELQVFALLAIGGIVSSVTFCYVDLGLTMGRLTVFLGTILGVVAVLEQIPAE